MPGASPTLLYDASGAPVSSAWAPITSRPGAALAATPGGMVGLGHDYANGPKAGTAYAPKVDAAGSQYAALVTAGGQPVHVHGGQQLPSQEAANGPVSMGLAGLTATPVQIDGVGNALAAPATLATFSVLASQVSVAAGKSMLALHNGNQSGKVLRLLRVHAQNSSPTSQALVNYQYMAVDVRQIAGYNGGTTLTPLSYDSVDALDLGIKAALGAAVLGEVSTPYRRWWMSNQGVITGSGAAEGVAGDQQGRHPWVERTDPSAKPITLRPGQGAHVEIVSSNATQGQLDVTFIFTQANA